MKKPLLLIFLALLIASLACRTPTPTQNTVEPKPLPTDTEFSTETIALPATETAPTESPPEITPETPPDVIDPPAQPSPLVTANQSGDTTVFFVRNPASGALITSFTASDVGWAPAGGVGGDYVFYLSSDGTSVHRAAFDGSTLALTFMNPTDDYLDAAILPSPDGTSIAWGSVLTFDESGANVALYTANVDGRNQRTLLSQHMERPHRPTPVHWSNDGAYLYYTNILYAVGGGVFGGGSDLVRIDLATGTEEIIFPNLNCMCSASVSPDGYYAARVAPGMLLVIKDLLTGTEQTLSLPTEYDSAGGILWSDDAGTLILNMAIGYMELERMTVIRVNRATLAMDTLLTSTVELYEARHWSSPDALWLNDKNQALYLLHLDDGSLDFIASENVIIPYNH